MKILVSGSLCIDRIMGFTGNFADEILPEKVHVLNVSFPTPKMREEFGGCCGNISYNLKILGSDVVPLATIGKDYQNYYEHWNKLGIPLDHTKIMPEHMTAQAFIITDQKNNQITAFHSGAMDFADQLDVPDLDIVLGCVSPNSKKAMLKHSKQLHAKGIPFLFDPGQALGLFSGTELKEMITLATYVAVNDYESEQIVKRTGWDLHDIAKKVTGLIVTLGGKGSILYTDNKQIEIPPEKPSQIVDPTGCGDSYRAGFLHTLAQGGTLIEACQLGTKMGAIKISVEGGQNHGHLISSLGKSLKFGV